MTAITLPLFLPSCAPDTRVGKFWFDVKDNDPRAIALFRRHYSCQDTNNAQHYHSGIAGPGETMTLLTGDADALFVWKLEQFRQDEQSGVNCSVFRNEGKELSSALIADAMQIAWSRWPGSRLFTFVRWSRIQSTNPGYCYQCAGWTKAGRSKAGLYILEAKS